MTRNERRPCPVKAGSASEPGGTQRFDDDITDQVPHAPDTWTVDRVDAVAAVLAAHLPDVLTSLRDLPPAPELSRLVDVLDDALRYLKGRPA